MVPFTMARLSRASTTTHCKYSISRRQFGLQNPTSATGPAESTTVHAQRAVSRASVRACTYAANAHSA